MHAELKRIGAPADLVQQLPAPVTKELTAELMKQADLVVVTGSQNNVRAGYSSGTPALGVGTGNVAVIVDDSADCADAARKIMASKIFDNATSCSSENAVIIHDKVYDEDDRGAGEGRRRAAHRGGKGNIAEGHVSRRHAFARRHRAAGEEDLRRGRPHPRRAGQREMPDGGGNRRRPGITRSPARSSPRC